MATATASIGPKRAHPEEGDGARGDQQGDGEDDADRLQRGDHGERRRAPAARSGAARPAGRGAGVRRVEGVQQEAAAAQEQGERDGRAIAALYATSAQLTPSTSPKRMWSRCTSVGCRDVEHEPRANMPEKTMPIAVSSFTRLFSFTKPVAQRADHAGGEGADEQREAEAVGEDDAGQDGMADRVAHQRPAAAARGSRRAAPSGRRRSARDQEGALHEVEGEGQQQVAHRVASARPARGRAASRPCFGAKTKAARKTSVCSTTMIPPVAPSRK